MQYLVYSNFYGVEALGEATLDTWFWNRLDANLLPFDGQLSVKI